MEGPFQLTGFCQDGIPQNPNGKILMIDPGTLIDLAPRGGRKRIVSVMFKICYLIEMTDTNGTREGVVIEFGAARIGRVMCCSLVKSGKCEDFVGLRPDCVSEESLARCCSEKRDNLCNGSCHMIAVYPFNDGKTGIIVYDLLPF